MLNSYAASCEKKHGKPIDLAVRSTYNPKTQKYFALHHQTIGADGCSSDCALHAPDQGVTSCLMSY